MADEYNTEKMEELVKHIDEMRRAIANLVVHQPDKASWTKHIGTGITVIIILAGIIGGWYTNKASVETLIVNHNKLENKVSKLEDSTHSVELNLAEEHSDLKSMRRDVEEVKQDVKDIKNKLMGH